MRDTRARRNRQDQREAGARWLSEPRKNGATEPKEVPSRGALDGKPRSPMRSARPPYEPAPANTGSKPAGTGAASAALPAKLRAHVRQQSALPPKEPRTRTPHGSSQRRASPAQPQHAHQKPAPEENRTQEKGGGTKPRKETGPMHTPSTGRGRREASKANCPPARAATSKLQCPLQSPSTTCGPHATAKGNQMLRKMEGKAAGAAHQCVQPH